jgi:hypothetical protein
MSLPPLAPRIGQRRCDPFAALDGLVHRGVQKIHPLPAPWYGYTEEPWHVPPGTDESFVCSCALDDEVIGRCILKHCSQEFIRFLRRIDRETCDLHLMLDNCAAHKTGSQALARPPP